MIVFIDPIWGKFKGQVHWSNTGSHFKDWLKSDSEVEQTSYGTIDKKQI